MSGLYCELSKLILNDVGEDICHVQSGSSYLLRDEACGGHAWGGVHFQEVDFVNRLAVFALTLSDDVIDAYDAVAVENVIDATGKFCHAAGCVFAETGRSDFLYLSVVFRVVVEELV